MNALFKLITEEISSSKAKFDKIDSSSIPGLARKFTAFGIELERLNKTIPEITNKFLNSKDLTDSQVNEIKEFIDKSMTDFITQTGIPGINPDFKVDVKIR